jgi:hypothetical protein
MKTHKASMVILCIGMAAGILIGYSLNDHSMSAQEQAHLREREAIRMALERFNATYAMDSQVRLENIHPSGAGVIQWPRQQFPAPRLERKTHPLLDQYRAINLGPDVDQKMDLIDLRYVPPAGEKH